MENTTWIVNNVDSDDVVPDEYNYFTIRVTVLFIVVLVSFATVAFFIVCMVKFSPCCQSYLRRRKINLPFHRHDRTNYDPCTNCQLIEMGETTCYTGVCSECGRVPASIARATLATGDTKQI